MRRKQNRASRPVRSRIGVDLFCGAGGMSLGFEQAGFDVVAAVDVHPLNVEVHKANFPNVTAICSDIRDLSGSAIRQTARIGDREIAVVFGGPPCQGFSVGGKQRARDPRNALLLEFARLVVELRPRYFVMENVAGLLGKRYESLRRRFKRVLANGGYSIVEPLVRLNAEHFGVPQRRKRVFVLGCREGEPTPSYPTATAPRVTVGAAIDDLKVVQTAILDNGDRYVGGLGRPSAYARSLRCDRHGNVVKRISGFARTDHSDEVVKRFSRVLPGEVDPVSRFARLKRDGVSPTLRAGTGKENGRFMAPRPLHPDFDRCITVREAARLHSFPDWFSFHDTKWNGFMQVGNSVPPAFARAVAEQLLKTLEG